VKRSLLLGFLISILQMFCGAPAAAQVSYTAPQSVTTASVFNGVSTSQASGCLSNLGQTVHFVFYTAGGATGAPTGVQIRIEASYNSDSATCSTGTWFAISDDGAEPTQNGTNLIFGIGAFPFLRVNLVKCVGCDASDTISANYTGTSSTPGNPFGTYGAGQQVRKMAFVKQTAGGGNVNSPAFVTPYGSTAGLVIIQTTAVFTGGILAARCRDGGSGNVVSFTLPLSGTSFVVPVPANACTLADMRCQGCTGTGTYSVSWYFYPPGEAMPASAQPANVSNSESTAVAGTASVTLTPLLGSQRSHVFSVSARCSAGTAGITVVDTTASLNLWTSGPAEVGTTTFKFQWNPGLAGATGDTITISLTTCGVANTGTLDVQASVF